jgi:hypothetical protein
MRMKLQAILLAHASNCELCSAALTAIEHDPRPFHAIAATAARAIDIVNLFVRVFHGVNIAN